MTAYLNSTPHDRSANRLRHAGIALALSTPISGIVSFAIASTLVGESRLETSQGMTALGWLAMATPLVIGLTAIALSFSHVQVPSRRTIALTAGALSLALLGLGTASILTAAQGDASIGGGILILTGLPLFVASLYAAKQQR